MPVYNAAQYLREAIDSILNQTFRDFEFIIINDGSTDRSLEIIQSYNDDRIRLINQKNTGLAKALNNGIAIAKSDFIARMDADDISIPERLTSQFSFLESNVDVVAVGSNAEVIDKEGNHVYCTAQPSTWSEIKKVLPNTPFIHPSVMFRKEITDNIGFYPDIQTLEDPIFFSKMSKLGMLVNLKAILLKYRIVPSAMSRKSKFVAKKAHLILNEFIKHGKIPKEDIDELKSLRQKDTMLKKQYYYHLYLAKKYLWNNYQPKAARKNLQAAIKIRPACTFPYLLFAASFLPGKCISYLYKALK